MALNNRRYLALGLADPQIAVPATAYAEAVETNHLSIVGRLLRPKNQDLYSVIQTLPHKWNVRGSQLRGRIIGGGKFQFLFDTERDLEMALWSGPYTYNGWIVVLQRWEDEPGPEFLRSVPMWVRIRGIPIRYLCKGTVREIASSMGEVMDIELDDKIIDLRYVRVRVNVSVDSRLCFKKVVRFESGEVKIVSLRYEDVAWGRAKFKFCRNCGDMKHLARSCKLPWIDVPDPYERSLSPPPPDAAGSDAFAENNGQSGTSDAVLDGVEMVGTSAEGSKRKFEASREEGDDIQRKRIRGSSDGTEDLGVNLGVVQEE
ncbi:unnamed protein product [Microthlaspi erraticum]|uniref:DUF4283 domain-containing protein n=1 Tax=Microthlaspi erraticum TaxID=1685480 RepID=A0A6D2K216_9BRAS|nr:unnamed protein product [Microthlaspi erraticum]